MELTKERIKAVVDAVRSEKIQTKAWVFDEIGLIPIEQSKVFHDEMKKQFSQTPILIEPKK